MGKTAEELEAENRIMRKALQAIAAYDVHKYIPDNLREILAETPYATAYGIIQGYGDFIRDARDSIMELVQRDEFCGLMRQVMPVLTVRQQGQLALMLEGYRMQEIVKRQHKSIRDYYRDLEKIRETVASVTGCGYHGENCTGATGTVSGKTGGVR